QGKVEYKDGADVSVLAGGMVTFVPTDPEIKVSAQGDIKPDGSFEMSTFREGDGVVPGKYTVLVAAPRFNVKGGRFKTPPQVLDERFKDLKESGLEITVTGPVSDYVVTVHKPLPN